MITHVECLHHSGHTNSLPNLASHVVASAKHGSDNALKAVVRLTNLVFSNSKTLGDPFCKGFVQHLAAQENTPKFLRTVTMLVRYIEDPKYPSAHSILQAILDHCRTAPDAPVKILVQSAHVLGELSKELDMNEAYAEVWDHTAVSRVAIGHARAYLEKEWNLEVEKQSAKEGDLQQYAVEQRKMVQGLARRSALRVIGLFQSKQAAVREAAVRCWPPKYPLSESAQALSDPSPKVRSAIIHVLEACYQQRKAPKLVVETIANLADDASPDVRRGVAKFMASHPHMTWECAIRVSALVEDVGISGLNASLRLALVDALFQSVVVDDGHFLLCHPSAHVLNVLFAEWGVERTTQLANAYARAYISAENEPCIRALQLLLQRRVVVDMAGLTPLFDLLFSSDETVAIVSVLTTALGNGQQVPADVRVSEVEAKLWRKILVGNNWAITRAYVHLLHALGRSDACVQSIKRLLASTQDMSPIQLNLCYSLSCFLEVGEKNDVGDAYVTLTRYYIRAVPTVKEDAIWIFVPLLHGLNADPAVSTSFARDSEAIFISFLHDILAESNSARNAAVLATLAQHAKERGDAMKLEHLTEFCDHANTAFNTDSFHVIAFLGTLYESGLLFPAALEFRSTLVTAIITNVDGAECAVSLLKTMDSLHVAAGFLHAKDLVLRHPHFASDPPDEPIRRIASVLDYFCGKDKNVVLRTVLKCVEAAPVRQKDLRYLRILAVGLAHSSLDSTIADWCLSVISKEPRNKQGQVMQAVAYWLSGSREEAFDDVVRCALSRKKRQRQVWLAGARDNLAEIASAQKRLRSG